MHNQNALSRNEAIYWPASVLPIGAPAQSTEPVLKPVYRRAGRKKLTPAQVADREQYLVDLKLQNAERRADERQRKAAKKENEAARKEQRARNSASRSRPIRPVGGSSCRPY